MKLLKGKIKYFPGKIKFSPGELHEIGKNCMFFLFMIV